MDIRQCDCFDFQAENVALLYCDPPYAHVSEDAYYGVGETRDDYLAYMRARLERFRTWLAPDSNLFLHVDWKSVHYLKVIADEVFDQKNFRNEIIWCFAGPSKVKRHLPRKHQTILWYGFGDYPFTQPRTPYTAKLHVGGKASWAGTDVDVGEYEQKGKALEDWWTDIPALCRNEKEKVGYDSQKPLKLMERIVLGWSRPGDKICDPFMGSGSFLEAGASHGRIPLGCDLNPRAVELVLERISRCTSALPTVPEK